MKPITIETLKKIFVFEESVTYERDREAETSYYFFADFYDVTRTQMSEVYYQLTLEDMEKTIDDFVEDNDDIDLDTIIKGIAMEVTMDSNDHIVDATLSLCVAYDIYDDSTSDEEHRDIVENLDIVKELALSND